MKKLGYIYKITSPSGKVYIGQTIDIIRRKSKYKRLSCKQQPKIYNSIVKYGWENHIFEVIDKIDYNIHLLNDREIFWIKEYNSFNDGLNLTAGGHSKEVSEETKEKIRQSKLGRPSPNKGKKMTDEQKKKISQKMLGNTNNRYFEKI
jgi:group I intron endonuclease